MRVPAPAPKRVFYYSGNFASGSQEKSVVDKLVSTRHFTQQVRIHSLGHCLFSGIWGLVCPVRSMWYSHCFQTLDYRKN